MRPIDANALLKRRRNFGKEYALDPVDKNIDDQLVDLRHVLNAPTIDYAPVVHGEWLLRHVGHGHYWECSECHTNPCIYVTENTKFCPNCGAKMDGGKDDG